MKDMQDKELLKVDFNEEEAILQFDGISRLLSSHKAGWKDVVLELEPLCKNCEESNVLSSV